ncbi:hypothetical protein TNCV_949361 [Trichonephila clavipes]|nr:hypothetical protein TNCV_949361 [Trichonephila clavipes]
MTRGSPGYASWNSRVPWNTEDHSGIAATANSLLRLVEGGERWEEPGYPEGVSSQEWGEIELNVGCSKLRITKGVNVALR